MSEDLENALLQLKEQHRQEISAISHEIRNPIALINSSLQLIELSCPQVKSQKYWNYIKDDLNYLCLLLDDISSFNNACILRHSAPCDLSVLLKETAASFLPELNRRKIRLNTRSVRSHIVVEGDAVRLKQVIINLMKNAQEAVADGGRIAVSLKAEDGQALLAVADNGCGIPPEEQEQIFLPFHTTKSHGTGLGLPIVREIVQAHGGSLTYSSAQEAGTTFSLLLPLRKC